jgi:pimeloyl-ACP methyl ester carboxylesterase
MTGHRRRIHGRLDTIVPIEHGRELAKLVPGAQFEELDCGHNDCPRQWDTVEAFLRNAGVINRR